MKNIIITLIALLILPAALHAQYLGGSGKGGVSSGVSDNFMGNFFKTNGNWSTTTNWSEGALPGSSAAANIAAAAVVDGDYSYPSMTIASVGSVTVSPAKSLTVSGTLTNNGTNAGLVIQSTAAGTGSLINSSAAVPAIVNRYLPGISQAWHLLSSPVAGQAISGTFTPAPATSYDFFAWYEPTGEWVNFKSTSGTSWTTANGNTNFTAGKGYLVEYTGTGLTKQFTGNLNAGTVSPTLTNSGTGVYQSYNLVGNPYPSAIDWKASGWDRSKLVESGGGYVMSIWNDAGTGNYGTFNSAGSSGSGTNGVSQYIPVGQGFMVKAISAGTLGMADGIRVHNAQQWLKATEEIANILCMKVSGNSNTYSDEIVIEFGHQTADGGAEKMFSFYETAPSLYTVKPEGNFSIDFQGEPTTVTIPMSFKAGADGNYTLTASQLESFTSSTAITLEDVKLNTTQKLMQNPVYTFSSAKTDDGARFLLHFGGAFSISENAKEQPVTVYASGCTIYIANKSGSVMKGDVKVYNMIGQPVMQQQLSENPLTRINLRGATGYYLVKVVTGDQVYSTKVFIN